MTPPTRSPDGRYRWVFTVTDAMERKRDLAIGAENGRVIVYAPHWWKTDGSDLMEEAIGSAYAQAVTLARQQRLDQAQRGRD